MEPGQHRYLLTIAGEWFGHHQIRCYLIIRQGTQWQTIKLSNSWIEETAHLLQPLLPDPEKRE